MTVVFVAGCDDASQSSNAKSEPSVAATKQALAGFASKSTKPADVVIGATVENAAQKVVNDKTDVTNEMASATVAVNRSTKSSIENAK